MTWKIWMLAAVAAAALSGCTCGKGTEKTGATREAATAVKAGEATTEPEGAAADPGAHAPYCDAEPHTDAAVFGAERKGMLGRFIAHVPTSVAMLCPGECEDPSAVDGDAVCSGVLVSRDLLLTTRSCILDDPRADYASLRQAARSRKAVFGWATDAEGKAPPADQLDVRPVEELVESGLDDGIDYALLRIPDSPGLRWGQMRLARKDRERQRVTPDTIPTGRYFFHHGGGKPAQFTRGEHREVSTAVEEVFVPASAGSRGGALLAFRTLELAGILVSAGDCAAGTPARAMTIDGLLDESRILKQLVTVVAKGNRTNLGKISMSCGSRSCTLEAGECDGKPCCDLDRDGVADDPPMCWETLKQGCSLDCPKNKPVSWSCGTGGNAERRSIEFVKDVDGGMILDECGDACSGTENRPAGFTIACHFLD